MLLFVCGGFLYVGVFCPTVPGLICVNMFYEGDVELGSLSSHPWWIYYLDLTAPWQLKTKICQIYDGKRTSQIATLDVLLTCNYARKTQQIINRLGIDGGRQKCCQ